MLKTFAAASAEEADVFVFALRYNGVQYNTAGGRNQEINLHWARQIFIFKFDLRSIYVRFSNFGTKRDFICDRVAVWAIAARFIPECENINLLCLRRR